MKLLVATRSAPKLREIRRILGAVSGLDIVSPDDVGLPEHPDEDGLEIHPTFEGNAEAKARWFHDRAGLLTVADDSGIAVDALGGRPGVLSKRFAPDEMVGGGVDRDEANNRHLLALLDGVPEEERGARFVCVAALVIPTGDRHPGTDSDERYLVISSSERHPNTHPAEPHLVIPPGDVRLFRGEVEGRILAGPAGSGGFGYDPLFFDAVSDAAFGELTQEAKEKRSHRGRAFRQVARALREILGVNGEEESG